MPNRNLISLLFVLVAVIYAAVSQGNGPAYLPGYALFSVLLVSWMHNRANIGDIEVTLARSVHGFAGTLVLVPFQLRSGRSRPKFGLVVETSNGGRADVARLDALTAGELSLPARRRGFFRLETVTVSTDFPLGVFRARRRADVQCEVWVYPEPKGGQSHPQTPGEGAPQRAGRRVPGDDFTGVRNYLTGESQRHVDWKAVARGMPMMVKQFEAEIRDGHWLDWDHVRQPEPEERLSQLAEWILHSERAGNAYGLRLPGMRIEPGHGDGHFHQCLRALATWGDAAPEKRGTR